MRLRHLCWNRLAALTCFAIVCAFGANAAELPPGLSKEKPATGPSVKVDGGYMVPYTVKIPGTEVSFEMIPVPGGTYKMGSPEDEEGRRWRTLPSHPPDERRHQRFQSSARS